MCVCACVCVCVCVCMHLQRFGYHREFMKDFTGVEGIHYHPYTAYQLLYPETYSLAYAHTQSHSFKYYSERGWRGFGKDAENHMLQNNEESDHDSDRRKTFMLARQHYSHTHIHTMLFPDRDEFLYCTPPTPKGRPEQRGSSNHTAQKALQHRHFRMLYRKTKAQSISITRIAHSARYPPPPPHAPHAPPSDVQSNSTNTKDTAVAYHRNRNVELDIQVYLSACLARAYVQRDMVQLWSCFSSASMHNTKSKSGEILLSQTCPFVGVHDTCVRCKCKKAVSKRCHYIHLNTVYFKPHKLYEKYSERIYEPLMDMIHLWN